MPEETAPVTSAPSAAASESQSQTFDHSLSAENASDSAQPNGSAESSALGNEKTPAKPKELSRYERTKRQRIELARREAALAAKEQEFASRERERTEAAKPKRDYTLPELRKYRQAWENEGRFDLVDAADKEIKVMETEEKEAKKASSTTVELPVQGTAEHKTQWEQAERELAQADPEFMREGTRLDTKLREIMAGEDGNIYRQHPRGIIAAYHRARMELLEADNKGLQTENSKLKDELRRLQGYTSIGGGAPGRVGNGNRVESLQDFARLSTKDMRAHLLKSANREGMPWF